MIMVMVLVLRVLYILSECREVGLPAVTQGCPKSTLLLHEWPLNNITHMVVLKSLVALLLFYCTWAVPGTIN